MQIEQTLSKIHLSPDLLRRLESLGLAARRGVSVGGASQRAGAVRGGRVEFRDHRAYVEGDDIRDLDWNLYARSDELFLKTYGAQRRKHVWIWLDLSASMFLTSKKAQYAASLAMALGYVGVVAGDWVQLFHAGTGQETPVRNTPSAVREWQHLLQTWQGSPPTDWNSTVRRWAATPRAPGLVVLISDWWCEAPREALRQLYGPRYDVALIQLRTPQEIDPPLGGNVRLEDVESGEEVSLNLNARDLQAYHKAVTAHDLALQTLVRKYGMRYYACRSDMALEHTVLTALRQGGLLR